jgi:hypothetical protein
VFLRHLACQAAPAQAAARLPVRRRGSARVLPPAEDQRGFDLAARTAKRRSLDGPTEVGSGVLREQPVPLSQLIDVVNERFGTDFNQADQLVLRPDRRGGDGRRRACEQAAAVNPETSSSWSSRTSAGEPLRRAHGSERRDLRALHERRAVPEGRDAWMASEAYRRLRSDTLAHRRECCRGHCRRRAVALRPPAEKRYVTCVPLLSAQGGGRRVRRSSTLSRTTRFEWVAVDDSGIARRGMFVAQVVGKSMEPMIPDGAYCLFARARDGYARGQDSARPAARRARFRDGSALHREAL